MWKVATVLALVLHGTRAQNAEDASCYGPGSITAAVIITLILTLLLLFVLYEIWRRYTTMRRGNHLVLEKDPEKGKAEYAYDNAAFGDITTTPAHQPKVEKNGKVESGKSKWSQWSPLAVLVQKSEKRTLDDSVTQTEVKTVSLKSHDFTGLGFNIYGNMREGIFIKDILHRGPASESGKLNTGDRIKSVTINFEHIVYEDALTILSYASPYEVILEAEGGKSGGVNQSSAKTVRLGHPLFRSSSTADLLEIGKSSKKRLFQVEDVSTLSSPYASLQKVYHSNAPTLERKKSTSPVQPQIKEEAVQKTENKYQKFGVRVLPDANSILEKVKVSPKNSELSQNDNNINLEKNMDKPEEIDENEEGLTRNVMGSGIKRDKDGIPQEIPDHMLNAAVAARRNRKSVVDVETEKNIEDTVKSPKKPKGRAPAPPQESKKEGQFSDSEPETDNQSSVNTIELNSSDITIHHSEEEDIQSRRTASTGDLTKIQKTRKISTGTLERAQSLDITDTAIPVLNKKRKGGSIDENIDSPPLDDDLYGKPHKEPRLSLNLEGLNTFQRNRLKKSSEWGNLEDAIITGEDGIDGVEELNGTLEVAEEGVDSEIVIRAESPPLKQISTTPIHFVPNSGRAVEDFLEIERETSIVDPFYVPKNEDLNVPDDIKVSRHTLGSLERCINKRGFSSNSVSNDTGNISNITVGDDTTFDTDELYTTALNTTLRSDHIESESGTINKHGNVSPSKESFDSMPIYTNNIIENVLTIRDDKKGSTSKKGVPEVEPTIKSNMLENQPKNSFIKNVLAVQNKFENIASFKNDEEIKGITAIKNDLVESATSVKSNLKTVLPSKNNIQSLSSIKNDYNKLSESCYSENQLAVQSDLVENVTISNSPESVPIIGNDFEKAQNIENTLQRSHFLENISMSENFPSLNDTVTIEGPTSLTLQISDTLEEPKMQISNSSINIASSQPPKNYSMTYVTEIQVLTQNDSADDDQKGQFESKVIHVTSKDPQKELNKIQQIAEEQLKKLPEMRFSTSTYESPKSPPISPQVEQIKSNFEKGSPTKTPSKVEIGKSRIPVATSKTPPTSPERRDSRNFDVEVDKEIVAIMSSPVHSTPKPKVAAKNVSITSIRSNSRIPSGFNRPPIPPKRHDDEGSSSTNGGVESSFKQWVFSPSEGSLMLNDNSRVNK